MNGEGEIVGRGDTVVAVGVGSGVDPLQAASVAAPTRHAASRRKGIRRLYSATLSRTVKGVALALVLQVLITGLAAGAGYGLVAIGYALIFRLTGVIHFALGELVGLVVFATLYFATGTGPATATGVGNLRYVGSMAGGLVVAVVCGLLVYVLAIRPFLRSGSLLGWIGGSLAVAFTIRGFLAATFERTNYVFPDPIPFDRLGHGGVIVLGGGVTVQIRSFFVIAVGLALAALAWWFLSRTETGRALQAIASEPVGARAVGLPVERLLAAAFALAGLLAGAAALVEAPGGTVSVNTGALLGIKGLVAALVARFGSPWRAVAAGLGLGVLEATVSSVHLGAFRLGPEYRDVIPLALVLVLLALRRLGRERAAAE